MLTLAAEMRRQGFDAELLVVNRIASAYLPNPEIPITDLHASRIRLALVPLARYLRLRKPDILFSAETPVNALAIVARMLVGWPRRLVVSEHNHLSEFANRTRVRLDRLRPLIARVLYPQADLVTAVSGGIAEDLVGSCGLDARKVSVVHNLLDVAGIQAQAEEAPEHPWLQEGEPPVILNVARLVPQKDQATLVRAFAIVHARYRCRLLILGEGPERANLERLIAELGLGADASLPGFVTNPYAWMRRARVFALSSAWEGLPVSLIEALAVGVPIVSTDCPAGPSEILLAGRLGNLVPVGDAQAFASALLEALQTPVQISALKTRALDFSIEGLLPSYVRALTG